VRFVSWPDPYRSLRVNVVGHPSHRHSLSFGVDRRSTVHPEPGPAESLLDERAEPLAAVHRITGPHIGRLAGAAGYPSWTRYLHQRPTRLRHSRTPPGRRSHGPARPARCHRPRHPAPAAAPRSPAGPPRGPSQRHTPPPGPGTRRVRRPPVRPRPTRRPPAPRRPHARPRPHRSEPRHSATLTLYWRIHLLADTALATDPPTGRAK